MPGVTVALVGPTAVGKSAVAIALAEALAAAGQPCEIVNADSMLVYREMDVGTAKPTPEERRRVVHHLLDVLDVREPATVADFQRRARAAVADCRARAVVPLLVGGSALYVRAIVDDFDFPGTAPEVRARWEAELTELGPLALHRRLAAVDPVAAAAIDPRNGRRIVRALEVITLTGAPFRASLPGHAYALPAVVQIGLTLPRPDLAERIARRVEAMWAAGFVEEVRRLTAYGLRDGLTASRALGYRQILQYLDGELTEAQAQESTIVATRKFARRQEAWFRRDPRIIWFRADQPDLVPAIEQLLREEG